MSAPVLTLTPALSRAQAFDIDPTILTLTEFGNVYEAPVPGAPSALQFDLPVDPAIAAFAIGPNSVAGGVRVTGFNAGADYGVTQLVTPKTPLLFPAQLQAAALQNTGAGEPGGVSVQGLCGAPGLGFGPLLTTTQRSPAGVDSAIDYARYRKPTLELYLYRRTPAVLPAIYRAPLIDRAGSTVAGVTIPASGVVRGWSIGQRKRIRLEVIEVNGGTADLSVTASGGVYLLAVGAPPIATPILETTVVALAAIAAGGSASFELEVNAEHLFLRAAATAGVPRFVIQLKAVDD